MLFKSLGDLTARHAWLILAAWVAVVVASISAAPSWDSVVENGEFAFLPQDSPSRVANAAFREAFPGDQMRSTLVLVARRESGGEGLLDDDFAWLSEHVMPELHRMSGVPREQDDAETSENTTTEDKTTDTDSNAGASKKRMRRLVKSLRPLRQRPALKHRREKTSRGNLFRRLCRSRTARLVTC
ncbi:MAG UNVERIFIED_CONTAM: hypothetical protein LVR18_52210 [Planctomycetaceae bacterium]|jgi:uncharacterized membrane protein YdfJ with MMPL/SSD domain